MYALFIPKKFFDFAVRDPPLMDPLWLSEMADQISAKLTGMAFSEFIFTKIAPLFVLFWNGVVSTADMMLSVGKYVLFPSARTISEEHLSSLICNAYVLLIEFITCVTVTAVISIILGRSLHQKSFWFISLLLMMVPQLIKHMNGGCLY
jgi:hypothetical protein